MSGRGRRLSRLPRLTAKQLIQRMARLGYVVVRSEAVTRT
jgi:hypothetical protein